MSPLKNLGPSLVIAGLLSLPAWSADDDAAANRPQHALDMEEMVIVGHRPSSVASFDEVRAADYELRPHATTQEILNNIPGLVVAQHQGGGKAVQYLIRGFDADHGTDFAVFVDDLPVNLLSHAHGQGYADLNFLIPETVERFQLYKGPYFAQFGDLATAGALNFVTGFHSNDARNALLGENDPRSAALVRAIGGEVGSRTRQFDRLDLAAALWLLDLDSELVFNGDAGNQEIGAGGTFQPAGATRRYGVDFEARYRITEWLHSDFDLSYAHARFRNGDFIPLAPELLINGGLTAEFESGFSIALRARYLADRPAIEDGSLTADGYELFDLVGKYRWHNVEASLALLNLTDAAWQEATFSDNSCVRPELGFAAGCSAKPGKQSAHAENAAPDIHFTLGNPLGVRGGLVVHF